MNNERLFDFLARFGGPHDVKIILREKKIGIFGALLTALRLRRGVPVAKIIHKKWFYGLPFYTCRHTLDPRPDSETLVAAVLAHEPDAENILDLGTGTGCLLCAVLKNIPNARGIGIDKSRRARLVARRNVKTHGLDDRAKIIRGSFEHAARYLPAKGRAVIIANPPYVPTGDKGVDRGASHDPKMALYGGADGLKYYRQIAETFVGDRTPDFSQNAEELKIYLEIGAGQGMSVRRIFKNAGWRFVDKYKDLSGRIRVLAFEKFV
jgi:release factor glutamine methyltransferase